MSAPAVSWQALAAPTEQRPAYTAESFIAALATGRDPGGRTLAKAMPRYRFSDPADADALVAFLASVRQEQRRGIGPRSVSLALEHPPGLEQTAKNFAGGFRAALAEAAPRGVHGRQILIASTSDEPFAVVGRHSSNHPSVSLFPLDGLIGDEDASTVRGSFATVAMQVEALLAAEPRGGLILIDDDLRSRRVLALLAPALRARDAWRVLPRADIRPVVAARVLVIGRTEAVAGLLRSVAGRPRVLGLSDEIGPLVPALARAGYSGLLADPRPAPSPRTNEAERYGRAAALITVAALAACGRNCTRARFVQAFDGLKLAPGGWPALDYGREALAGTDIVEVAEW